MKFVTVAIVVALAAAALAVDAESCAERQLVPTTTFVPSEGCEVLTATKAECWAPHVPTMKDVALIPAGAVAKVPFSWIYTPLRVASLIVAEGATLEMSGGAIQVSECMQVLGRVALTAPEKPDNSVASTTPFLADASAPLGVDCATVSRGYTPRLCGPGVVAVRGVLTVSGFRASLFARTEVEKGTGRVEFSRMAYLWGTLVNDGALEADALYLQGAIVNSATGAAHMTSLRVERFALMDKFKPVSIVNRGSFSFTSPDASAFWKYLSSKDVKSAKELTKLKFVNEGALSLSNLHYAHVFAGIDLDMFNHRGTITWLENHDFYLTGSMVNSEGTLVANEANVFLNDYVSEGGSLSSSNGGWFHFGSAAGVDTKTTVLCEKKQKKLVQHAAPVQLPVRPFQPKVSNVSCNPQNWDSCPSGLCCGAHGYCEEPRCMNADGYGGGPVCCPDNAFCGGSSHGPYCGAGIFSWEVDPECMAELEYVDRFEFDVMVTRFPELQLPKFGKHRYTMRGESRVESDGTGGVAFTETIEVRDKLRVTPGATLSNLMDNGAVPFTGKGTVSVEGRFVGGIKTTYDKQQNIEIQDKGRMEVPAYGTVWLHDTAHLQVKKGGTLQVDGKIFVLKKSDAKGKDAAAAGIEQCGTLAGAGGVVAEVPFKCNGQQ
jgi:hypothetical protein